ncbi:MAG: hypothetical protein IT450_12410 [Phycisphaerales bacterium]|nr:hypothetical protein [Phycisphaerales bacterium]
MRRLPGFLLTFVAILAIPGGCVVTIEPDGNNNDNGGTPGATTIRVRVINSTNVTLDPEVYASATAVNADGLFVDGNKYTAFGVGTLGLLGPQTSDTFEIDCANARVIGTKGGKFGDNLNQPDGVGQQVVLTQDLSIFCGGTLTLTYSRSGSGFRTDFTVVR